MIDNTVSLLVGTMLGIFLSALVLSVKLLPETKQYAAAKVYKGEWVCEEALGKVYCGEPLKE